MKSTTEKGGVKLRKPTTVPLSNQLAQMVYGDGPADGFCSDCSRLASRPLL